MWTVLRRFYTSVCNGDKIPLFLQGGDRLTVSSVGRVVHNYTVEGSEESELLRRFISRLWPGCSGSMR